jgi:hypothetical protein
MEGWMKRILWRLPLQLSEANQTALRVCQYIAVAVQKNYIFRHSLGIGWKYTGVLEEHVASIFQADVSQAANQQEPSSDGGLIQVSLLTYPWTRKMEATCPSKCRWNFRGLYDVLSYGGEPFSRGRGCAGNQELPSILWNPKGHYNFRINLRLVSILSQINHFHNTQSYLSSIQINSIIQLRLGLPSCLFLLGFPAMIYRAFLFSLFVLHN